MKAWIRQLYVRLSSTKLKKSYEFGKQGDQDIKVEVTGTKYLSAMKDNFVVKIWNLDYAHIVRLIQGEFYKVEIYAGYRGAEPKRLFKGAVLYISNQRELTDNIVYIICVNEAMGAIGQARMNLTMKSGINMYSAIKFIARRAGIANPIIGDDFKNKVLHEDISASGTGGSVFDSIASSGTTYVASGDASEGSALSMLDLYRTDARLVKVKADQGMVIGGYPTISSDGLSFTSLPVFNYMPGDTLLMDNSLIDMSVTNKNDATSTLPSTYIDSNGKYVIWQLDYDLSLWGNFNIRILAKAKDLVGSLATGG